MSMAFATKLREMQEQIALIADAVEEIQHALASGAQKQEIPTNEEILLQNGMRQKQETLTLKKNERDK